MTRYVGENPARERFERERMRAEPAILDKPSRRIVLDAISGVCRHEAWELHAAHVRTNHVHAAVTADDVDPEAAMGKFKAYASRALNKRFGKRTKRWARHGSTVWIWDAKELGAVVDYVLRGQGEPMAVYDPRATEPQA